MVGQDDEIRSVLNAGIGNRLDHLCHVRVGNFDRRQRLRRIRPKLVLRIVCAEDVQQHQVRPVLAHDEGREAGAVIVGHRPGDGPALRFVVVEQQTRTRDAAHQVEPLRVARDAAKLRHQVVDVRIDRRWPAHRSRRQATRLDGREQRRHLDVARVPIPAGVRRLLGIEDEIVVDAVHGRHHASDHRRVRRVRYRRRHADHAVGKRALLSKPPQASAPWTVRGLCMSPA